MGRELKNKKYGINFYYLSVHYTSIQNKNYTYNYEKHIENLLSEIF